MEELASNIMGSSQISGFIKDLQNLFANIGYGFAVVFFLINLAIIYVNSLMGSNPLGWNTIKPGLLRAIIVIGLLTAYSPFIAAVDGVFYGIYNDIKDTRDNKSADFKSYLKKRQEDLARQEQSTKKGVVDIGKGLLSPSSSIKESVSSIVVSYIHSIVTFLLGIIGVIALIIAWAQIQIFKIIGPLSMTFSILEIWKANWMKWFNGYVGGFGAMIVIVTLGLVQESMSSVILRSDGAGLTAFIAMDIIMIGMYLAAFRIGSYIVGDAALGAIAPLTTLAAGGGALAATKLGSGVKKGAQSFGSGAKELSEKVGPAAKDFRDSIRNFLQRKK